MHHRMLVRVNRSTRLSYTGSGATGGTGGASEQETGETADAVVEIEVVREVCRLEALVPEWLALSKASARSTPFQRPERLLPWWRPFGQQEMFACVFRAEARLVGLLPLYAYREPHAGERKLLLIGAGTSDHLDGVFAPECGAAEIVRAWRLLALETSWDTAYLMQLRPGSPLITAMEQLGLEVARRCAGESTSRTRALPVAELPKKLRADVRYFRNAAIGRGKLELRLADAANSSMLRFGCIR